MTLLTIVLPSDAVIATLNLIPAENNNVFGINYFDEPNNQKLRKLCNLKRPTRSFTLLNIFWGWFK